MRVNAVIAGVGMTRFAKHLDKGLKQLGGAAVLDAVKDAGLELGDIEAAYVGNCAAGTVTGQESIRGQVIFHSIGLGLVPVVNVENACASGSTALNQACLMVSAGAYDVVLALGVEKLYHEDKRVSYAAFAGAVDVEERDKFMAAAQADASSGSGTKRSMFIDFYSVLAKGHMDKYGSTVENFAQVSAKNSFHGSLNPRAQFREELSVEEVLAAPMVVAPLTRPMCCPIGDGAAAVVVVSERQASKMGIAKPVRVVSSVLHSAWEHPPNEPSVSALCVDEAYREAGIGPEDLDVVELHDASAPSELMTYDSLLLCDEGDCVKLIEDGVTKLGGRLPVNPSGGLLRKGHPVGATGVAQIVELTEQLQGRSGKRQVEGARAAMAHNGGGTIANEVAAMSITVLLA
jgi:acetyl-CoA acetyltransferase